MPAGPDVRDFIQPSETVRPTRSFATGRSTRRFTAPARERRRRLRPVLTVLGVIVTVLVIVSCAVWLWGVRIFVVSSNSMAPTLQGYGDNHDRVACWMLTGLYRSPERWEIVVFQAPPQKENGPPGQPWASPAEHGVTVKRLVGLPGEELAIAGGDIWTRSGDAAPFVRQAKPAALQRELWLGVYAEDFQDVSMDDFLFYWEASVPEFLALTEERTLALAPGGSIRYLPRYRDGYGEGMRVLPGIPDRYVLPQTASFICRKPECLASYLVPVDSQAIRARCRNCGTMNFEDSVDFYSFRSGIPDTGPYSPGKVNEADTRSVRDGSYHFVSDLRVVLEMRLDTPAASCSVVLADDTARVAMTAGGGGVAVGGSPLAAASALPSGEWQKLEFHRADGRVRVYVADRLVYDELYGSQTKPEAGDLNKTNSVTLSAAGGRVDFRRLQLDRDIHYFSGGNLRIGAYFGAMDETDAVQVPPGTFLPLGDNTTVSLDGRSWGALDMRQIRGSALGIWSPEERRRFF